MPDNRRTWTEEDIAKLKNLAGKLALREIATELGRTPGATAVEASKLGLSLSRRPAGPPGNCLMEVPSKRSVLSRGAWVYKSRRLSHLSVFSSDGFL